jgi:flagellar hook-length control protein FliK
MTSQTDKRPMPARPDGARARPDADEARAADQDRAADAHAESAETHNPVTNDARPEPRPEATSNDHDGSDDAKADAPTVADIEILTAGTQPIPTIAPPAPTADAASPDGAAPALTAVAETTPLAAPDTAQAILELPPTGDQVPNPVAAPAFDAKLASAPVKGAALPVSSDETSTATPAKPVVGADTPAAAATVAGGEAKPLKAPREGDKSDTALDASLDAAATGPADKPPVEAKPQIPAPMRHAEPSASNSVQPALGDIAKLTLAQTLPAQPIVLPQQRAAHAEAVASLRALPIEIGMSVLKGLKQFTIRLDPAELGKVEVKLSMDDEGQVQAKLTVDRVDTLYLLQRDARTLERAFDQAGLKTSPDSLDFSLRNPGDGARQQGGSAQDRTSSSNPDGAVPADITAFFQQADITQLRQIASAARGGVDRAI